MPSRLTDLSDTMICWQSETPHSFNATLFTGQDRRFLVVERLPDMGWDWVTWGDGRHSPPLYGTATTARQAMEAAGRSVRAERVGSVHVLRTNVAAGLHC